jgi:hypothetical protein
MIFITLYLSFLQFVTDYSESKDKIVPSSINIIKYDRLKLESQTSIHQSDFGTTFKIACLLNTRSRNTWFGCME